MRALGSKEYLYYLFTDLIYDYETRLHWRVRNCGRPSRWEDNGQPDWPHQQVLSDQV